MPENTGLLISFDGTDSSGKETQAKRLAARLRAAGYVVHSLTTPDYTTPSGRELKMRLQNMVGNWHQTPWQEKLGYFAANRAEHRQEVIDALAQGEVVIYDRYVPSSLAFITIEARQEDQAVSRTFIQEAVAAEEYDKNRMPKEDISIFLDVPVEIAARLLEQRKAALKDGDEYTDHSALQQKLYDEYVRLCGDNPAHCVRLAGTSQGRLLTIQAMEDRIWQELAQRFPRFFAAT